MDVQDNIVIGQSKTMQKMNEFRYIVPQGTTTEPPKLQQAWRVMETGEIEWQTIPCVVVPNHEFFRI